MEDIALLNAQTTRKGEKIAILLVSMLYVEGKGNTFSVQPVML